MNHLDLTFENAEHNLACDEALLDLCEDGQTDEILRFWEPKDYFVVLGYSNKIRAEVAINSCKALGVPILRRVSGGGTVLQGPGCLNYSLILKIDPRPELKNLTETNQFILSRHRAALSPLSKPLEILGISDLALGGLKVSGNAQRRKKKALLYHGTFLLDFDLKKIGRCLNMPSRQPDYRQNRPHEEFVTNLKLPAAAVKETLRNCWNAHETLKVIPKQAIEDLVQNRYARTEWHEKF